MDVAQIDGVGRELGVFLTEFDGCFGRREPREHLRVYVAGQVSDLERKSVEPIAWAGCNPRVCCGLPARKNGGNRAKSGGIPAWPAKRCRPAR